MLRHPAVSCKGIWRTLTVDAFVTVRVCSRLGRRPYNSAKFEVLALVVLKIQVCRVVTACQLAHAYCILLVLTTALTHSTVQSPSWAANWFAATQEIPRTSRNPKVHYRTQKRPPPVSILGQPNLVHILTFHLLQIHPNIIHTSTPRS